MAKIKKNWTEKLESLPVAPSFTVSDEDKASVSATMSRFHTKGKKEFALKKSILTDENIIVRIV